MPIEPQSAAPAIEPPLLTVCICTCGRPKMLARLLEALPAQQVDGVFRLAVAVADNDRAASARATVEDFVARAPFPVAYAVEPEPGIARARNLVLSLATGDYLAFIDDDEFPAPRWLLTLFETLERSGADGVLGPVRRFYASEPPLWLRQSTLLNRPIEPTGTPVLWQKSRTGNVLLRRRLIAGQSEPFRVELPFCEDQDFFRRQIAAGARFIWSAEADVFEELPPERWRRRFFLHRALRNGALSHRIVDPTPNDLLHSLAASAVHLTLLPVDLLRGRSRWLGRMERLCYHVGKLEAWLGFGP